MSSSSDEQTKREVHRFWEAVPCGSWDATAPEGTAAFFDQVEERRYSLEPFIRDFARFGESAGQKVLEIGVGLGTDHVQFARSGALLSGVDLTEHGVRLVRERLALEEMDSDLAVADAEQLPFADNTFDRVYSWGVLHHTPNTAKAVGEAIRVLKPGGEICVMMYSRHAWVSYGLWLRNGPLSGKPFRSIDDVLFHHMESLGTKGFSKRQVKAMFVGIERLKVRKVATPYDREYARAVASMTGRWFGFFMVTSGTKQRPR